MRQPLLLITYIFFYSADFSDKFIQTGFLIRTNIEKAMTIITITMP